MFRVMRLLLMVVLSQLLVSGCVGFAVSVESIVVKEQLVEEGSVFENKDYLPRAVGRLENVVKDELNKEIRYSTRESHSTCYYHFILFPWYPEKCGGKAETWFYKDIRHVTVTTQGHRLYGIWCSPVPNLAMIGAAPVGINDRKNRNLFTVFCDFHFGSWMHEAFHF